MVASANLGPGPRRLPAPVPAIHTIILYRAYF